MSSRIEFAAQTAKPSAVAARASFAFLAQQVRQFGDVCCDPSRLILREQLAR